MLALIATIGCSLALLPAGARWLRVAQREHYIAGSATRFALRWWGGTRPALLMAVVAVAAAGIAFGYPIVALATAVVVVAGPPSLSLRGRTSPLAFTRRLRLLAGVWLVLQAVVVVVGVLVHRPAGFAAVGACAVPLLVDGACAILTPVEHRLVAPFITAARKRLTQVDPTVVAITGSFGKTSTKQHVAHLVSGTRTVVASPASFNNRAGLARAVNEQLTPGTEVFVAEMGTYGKGEIAELCRWCPPSIAAITAIGPVHLERFKTEEAIVEAKAEITASAHTVVLNIDNHYLAALADRLEHAGGKKIVRCSALDPTADVCVLMDSGSVSGSASVFVDGAIVGGPVDVPGSVQPTNLACAIALALALGVPPAVAVGRISGLPSVPNRLVTAQAASGVWVVDDTFNSNPAGARVALSALAATNAAGRRVVVTPGMVELGRRQFDENKAFAHEVVGIATDLVVVGFTNRAALLAGASPLVPLRVRTRDQAVEWVRANLSAGDVVLYENDLPDHYR